MRKTLTKLGLVMAAWVLPLAARADAVELTNPLGVSDAKVLIVRILRYSLGIIGVIALVMIIYGGFLMLTSGGNADTIKKAKATIVWAAAGIAVILGSWAIIQYIFQTVNTVSGS